MGTWDESSFGNDQACDWAYGLEKCKDLSFIEETLQGIIDAGDEYLDSGDAVEGIAAAEVLAWLRGHPTPVTAYTENIAAWVATHPLSPPPALIEKALAVLDRVQAPPSELAELWAEGDDSKWLAEVNDLRTRLTR